MQKCFTLFRHVIDDNKPFLFILIKFKQSRNDQCTRPFTFSYYSYNFIKTYLQIIVCAPLSFPFSHLFHLWARHITISTPTKPHIFLIVLVTLRLLVFVFVFFEVIARSLYNLTICTYKTLKRSTRQMSMLEEIEHKLERIPSACNMEVNISICECFQLQNSHH